MTLDKSEAVLVQKKFMAHATTFSVTPAILKFTEMGGAQQNK
jgi:hypothetical protein